MCVLTFFAVGPRATLSAVGSQLTLGAVGQGDNGGLRPPKIEMVLDGMVECSESREIDRMCLKGCGCLTNEKGELGKRLKEI